VPASTRLAEALKAQVIRQRLPRGGHLLNRTTLTAGGADAKQVLSKMVNDIGEHRERLARLRG
jgi:hypothetical protein